MTVTVDRPAAAAPRRVPAVLLRAAGVAAVFVGVGAVLYRGTPAENGVDIGAGILRIAVLAAVVTAGGAFDGRRRGFGWAAQVWAAAIGLLAAGSVVRMLLDSASSGPADAAGVAFGLLGLLGLPLVGLAVAGSAVGAALHRRGAAGTDGGLPVVTP